MDITKLKSLRAAHRSAATKLLKKIEDAKENSAADIEEISVLFNKLALKEKTLSSFNEQILEAAEENVEEEIYEIDEYHVNLDTKIRHLRKFFDAKSDTNVHSNDSQFNTFQPPTCSSQQSSSANVYYPMFPSVSSVSSVSHLPKLTLPKFDGNILMWQTFWDSFESAVHMNLTLTDVQKFSHLKSLLVDEASRTIAGFSLTNVNYTEALNLLKERYGQSHKISNAYMQALLDIPVPSYNLYSLRNYYDKLETYIRGLESLGQPSDSFGSLLIPIILNKLPSEIRQNLARENGSDFWQLKNLRRGINKELNIMEAGKRTESLEPIATASFLTSTNHKKSEKFTSRDQVKTTVKQKPCIYCTELHDPAKCSSVTDYNRRLSVIKEKRLCFNCLGTHKSSDCKSKFRCRHCSTKHHTSICTEQLNVPSSTQAETKSGKDAKHGAVVSVVNTSKQDDVTEIGSFHSSTAQSRSDVLLKTAIAPVWFDSQASEANILFDEGAQRSFMTEKLASQLNLKVCDSEVIQLSTFGESNEKQRRLPKVSVFIESTDGCKIPIDVLVVPKIAGPMKNLNTNNLSKLKYLRNLRLAHPVSSNDVFEISLLIGADFYWNFVEDEVHRGDGPTAVKSKVGYLLSGPTHNTSKHTSIGMYNILTDHKIEEFDLQSFWQLESIGIRSQEIDNESTDYMKNYQMSSIEFRENRYVAKLPWKPEHEPLPTNYSVVKRRTENVIKRLSRNPKMMTLYDKIIKDQEQRGFIEKVDNHNETETTNTIHYIPHHPVKKDSTTTPVRIVYDCSCRESSNKPSLNDCLMNDPPELNDLTQILVRFRLNPVAVVSDIEKAFLHVGLHEQDRDVTRFLWISDPTNPESELTTYRFKSVLFGATCSPFILSATLLKHLEQNDSEISRQMKRDLYVDNILSSVTGEKEAMDYYEKANDLMKKGGFTLRSWTSNSQLLRNQANKDEVLDTDAQTKILGLRWSVKNDEIAFVQREMMPTIDDCITKREILKTSSRIYDPLGLLSPVTVRAKLMMQELWQGGYGWDELLPIEIQTTWKTLAADIQESTSVSFCRRYFTTKKSSPYTLQVFTDASMKAYGAVAYLRTETESAIVMARVAPLKILTLPQLELMAAIIGARLAVHLKSAMHGIQKVEFWCDSQIVLHWISSKRSLKRFVENRVNEIRRLTLPSSWNYCPTEQNPADLLTRGISASQFMNNSLWNQGPKWLVHGLPLHTVLSTLTEHSDEDSDDEVELARTGELESTGISEIMRVNDYNSYRKLIRVTGYALRFIANCRLSSTLRKRGPLQAEELHNGIVLWIKSCQKTAYRRELTELNDLKKRRSPRLRQLNLFLDNDGLIRCRGRIHNAPIPDSAKFPYLIPADHHLAELIVLDAHKQVLHAGVNATVTQIRQLFWIPAARQFVKGILRKCVTCRKVSGIHYTAPDPPPLPKVRLQDTPPFSVTGIDFTGALFVKDKKNTVTKAYVCLFTCASTRAVHLEVISDLTVDSFLQALTRFTSRKSTPQVILSDNGSTFVAASEELRNLFKSDKLQDALVNRGIEWRFIPKRAPWYGGFWERLISLTKNSLKKILGRALVDKEMLQTAVVEIEKILNDRPLTYISSDINDYEPLTPSHLLYGRRITSFAYPKLEIDESSFPFQTETLTKRTKRLNIILEHYWTRWKSEYLTSLREFHKVSGNNDQTIQVGDIVQVHDDTPRSKWKLAVITGLIRGNDGLVRAAHIKMNGTETNRPIVKLYPLEVNTNTYLHETNTIDEQSTDVTCDRLKRKASVKARQNIRDWINIS